MDEKNSVSDCVAGCRCDIMTWFVRPRDSLKPQAELIFGAIGQCLTVLSDRNKVYRGNNCLSVC